MPEQNDNKIFDEADKYRSYFKEDEVALDNIVQRLMNLQSISDTQLTALSQAMPGKGTQHYIIEHMTNAIAIQSQMQSVVKDKRSIKERSLDLAIKMANGEDIGDSTAILASVQSFINEQKRRAAKDTSEIEKAVEKVNAELDLDAEIEKKLGDNN